MPKLTLHLRRRLWLLKPQEGTACSKPPWEACSIAWETGSSPHAGFKCQGFLQSLPEPARPSCSDVQDPADASAASLPVPGRLPRTLSTTSITSRQRSKRASREAAAQVKCTSTSALFPPISPKGKQKQLDCFQLLPLQHTRPSVWRTQMRCSAPICNTAFLPPKHRQSCVVSQKIT